MANIVIPKYVDPRTLDPKTQPKLSQSDGKSLSWDETVTAIRTKGTPQNTQAKVQNKQNQEAFFQHLADVPKAIVEQYTKPSEAVVAAEKQLGAYKPVFKNLNAPKLDWLSDLPVKIAVRTFHPMLEPFGKDVAQLVVLRDIMPKVESGELPLETLKEFDILQKTAPQIVGDVSQVVLAIYSPSILGKNISASIKSPVLEALQGGFIRGAEAGLGFGAAQAASSGSTDPREISTIMANSVITMGVLGAVTSGAIPVTKEVFKKVTDTHASIKADLMKKGYTAEEATNLANHGGYIGGIPEKGNQIEMRLGQEKGAGKAERMGVREKISYEQLVKQISNHTLSRFKEKNGITEWKNATKKQLEDVLYDIKQLNKGDEMLSDTYVEGLKEFGINKYTTKQQAAAIMGDILKWKDRSHPIFNFFHTMDLRIDKSAGSDAGKIKDILTRPREKAVTGMVKEEIALKTDMRDMLDNLKVNTKKDRALIMRYGEKRINLTDLKRKTPKWEQIVEADAWFREQFTTLRISTNKTLEKFYKNKPKKLIAERKDYYTHAQEEGSAWSMLMNQGGEISPVLEYTSEFTKPHSKFNPFALQRKGSKNFIEDAGRAFEAYLSPTLNNKYMTESVVRHRAVSDILAHKTLETKNINQFIFSLREAANKLSGKTSAFDRSLMNSIMGRGLLNLVTKASVRLGKNRIVGNIASAFMQTAGIPGSVLKNNIIRTSKGMLTQGFSFFLGKDDPILQSEAMLRRYGEKGLHHGETVFPTILNKGEKVLAIPMEFYEKNVTMSIWRASYDNAYSQGFRGKELLQAADEITGSIVGYRAIGEKAPAFESGVLSLPLQFQLEVNTFAQLVKTEIFDKILKNPLNNPLKDTIKNTAQATSAAAQTTVALFLMNTFFDRTIGRTPLPDPIRTGIGVANADDWFEAVGRIVGEGLSSVAGGQLIANFMSDTQKKKYFGRSEVGIYPGGIPLANAIKTAFADPKKLVYDFGFPYGGGQAKKIYEGAFALVQRGSYSKDGKLQFPISRDNWFRVLIFGKYSTKAAQEFFDKARQPLTEKQTDEYFVRTELDEEPEAVYNDIMKDRIEGEYKKEIVKGFIKKIKANANEGLAAMELWRQEGKIDSGMEKDIMEGLKK